MLVCSVLVVVDVMVPRVRVHLVCCWCRRLKHRHGEPHGPVWPSLSALHDRGVSGGVCRSCKTQLLGAAAEVRRHR